MGLDHNYNMNPSETSLNLPYPAQTRQASATINNIPTDVMSMSFSDKIMITITQEGHLAQWLTTPLAADNPTTSDPHFTLGVPTASEDSFSLLPTARFQPRTLLGATGGDRETLGQLYASQIASMITTKDPAEEKTLMLGLGLVEGRVDRDVFLEIVNLVLEVI